MKDITKPGTLVSLPKAPPMTPEQAELVILSKAPPGGVFFVPFGQHMDPQILQIVFEKTLLAGLILLYDVNYHPLPGPPGRPPTLSPVRYFKLSEEGVRRLAMLRANITLN